ncbi:MAG: methyltransferase domain-containing protein [Anaeromyxobacter sp.]
MLESDEARSVRERYLRRDPGHDAARYSPLTPSVYLTDQERERAIIGFLRSEIRAPLSGLSVVEIGCGGGRNLLELISLGFAPENLHGVELLESRAEAARRVLPSSVRISTGDASGIVIPPASHDIVYQSLVFSSILDSAFRADLARSMWQWVRPGGGVLWYDFTYDNPANPDVRGVKVAELRGLFPEGVFKIRRVTLAPPISRRATRVWPGLYGILNALPLLRTHVLAWIGKPG